MTMREILDGGFPNSETRTVRMRTKSTAGTGNRKTRKAAPAAEEKAPMAEETSCAATAPVALSGQSTEIAPIQAQKAGETKMAATFNLKGLNKRGTQAIYTGTVDGENGGRVKTAIRVPLAAFAGKDAPQSFTAEGPFAVRGKSRNEMTAEEKKAARQNRPKLTLAEKAQKAEERAARLRKQLEAQAQGEPAAAAM